MINITGIENDISRDTARRAYYNMSHRPEQRGDSVVQSYIETMQALAAFITANAKDERQQAIAQATFDNLRDKYRRATLDHLAAQSRCASPMITGPARFPTERNRKAMESERKRSDEWLALHNSLESRALKALAAVYTEQEVQASEIDRVRADIASAERNQQLMKDCNAAIRKGDTDRVRELLGDKAEEVLKPDFCGRVGFPSFSLTNNLANIKRMKARLAELETKAERAETKGETRKRMNGVEIVWNYTEDRLQLLFDDKPSEAVRGVLKSNGYKWAPSANAWQRKLTANATFNLKHYLFSDDCMKSYLPAKGDAA